MLSQMHDEVLACTVDESRHHFFLDNYIQVLQALDNPDKALATRV